MTPPGPDAAPDGRTTSSLAFTIMLHLAPGAVFAAAYVAVAAPMREAGVPPIATFCLITVLVLIPLELGYLLMRGRRRNGRLSLAGVVQNRESMSVRSYVLWIPTLFAVTFVLFNTVGTVTTPWLRDTLFHWVPAWQADPFGLRDPGRYSDTMVVVAWIAALIVNGIAVPIVEELYFRGHLLPRLGRFGAWAPVVNTVLFVSYHFVSPWHFFARTLSLIPLFSFVWRRHNIYVGMVVHCALNTISPLVVLPQLLGTL